ncbi:unnamed protein product, partial [Iphiclides podalirius]
MRRLRGQSTYYNDYCEHLSPEFKTRPFKPRVKKLRPCHEVVETKEEDEPVVPHAPKLAMKDTELMKAAKEMYDGGKDTPTLEPLPTHFRTAVHHNSKVLGYVRPCYYNTGLTEYQGGIARLAYELVRDDRIPRYHAHNGCRPRWGLPPEGQRQPELDVVPFEDQRLY